MISTPTSARELGITHEGCEDLARNVQSMALVPKSNREETLRRADRELPSEIRSKAMKLFLDLCYDPDFCKEAGVPYEDINPHVRIIKTALAEYLLREKPFAKN